MSPDPRTLLGPWSRPRRLAAAAAVLAALGAWPPRHALAQATSPVYVDDSARAADALVRAAEMAAIGNLDEASRVLQSLIDEEGDRLIATPGDPDAFVTVRRRVIDLLLEKKPLLDRYRELEGPAADRDVADGKAELVEQRRLLTDAGFEAALRVAQLRFESAQFESAWRTLVQLDRHPARADARAKAAAELAATIAGYLGAGLPDAERRERLAEASPLVERWRSEAGPVGAPLAPAPTPTLERQQGPADPGPGIDLSQLLAHPLASASMGERIPLELARGEKQAAADLPDSALWLYAFPRVAGDWAYANDSQSISSWNRFTLSERWRTRVLAAPANRQPVSAQNNVEYPSTVAIEGDRLVAVMGISLPSQGRPNQAVVGLEASTGRLLWSRRLDDFPDEALADASFAGPAIIDQGVAVFAIERDVSRRRLDSVYLVGLDLETGVLRWLRPLGSTGATQYGYSTSSNESLVAWRGLILRSDEIGFVAAVEPVTGRLQWMRRLPGPPAAPARAEQPWQSRAPVIAGRRAFVLCPRRQEVVSLDAETGAVIASCPASRFASPDYLLLAGDRLVGVSANALHATPLASFGPGCSVVRIGQLGEGVFRGRVVVAGGRLLAPTRGGVAVFDPASPDQRPAAVLALDQPGNILPLESELLVADDHEVHTYLLWDVAERILRERMDEEPGNPIHAVTYAELAYRAGRPQSIIPAVDKALGAIERDPLGEQVEASQRRLVRSLLSMLEPGQEQSAIMLDAPTRAAIVDRLSRCASTPGERVAYLLAAGQFHEGDEQFGRAVEAYQGILDRPELAASRVQVRDTEVEAQVEATRRLRQLVQARGSVLYDAYQREAERELAAAANALDPEPFEAVARRYPVARTAPRAWIEAASRYQRQGRPQLAAQALEEGVASAADTTSASDPLVGELAGRLIQHLVRQELLYPAIERLRTFSREHPGVALTEEGRPLDAASIESTVRALMHDAERRPAIGPDPGAGGAMRGWAIAPGLAPDQRWAATDRLMMLSEDQEFAVFVSDAPGQPRKLWGGVHDEDFLWMDRRGAFFRRKVETAGDPDRSIIRRNIDTGEAVWTTPPLRTFWSADELTQMLDRGELRVLPRIDTPLSPSSRVTELTIAFDRQTMVVVDRAGRAAAFDIESGRALWAKAQTLRRMHDIALDGGTLLIGGSDEPIDFRVGRPDPDRPVTTGAVLSLDARSGQVIHRYQSDQPVRWVRLAPEGFAVVGLESGIIALDPYRGRVRWSASHKGLRASLAAWVLPGRVIVRRDDDRLWQVRTADGAVNAAPIDVRGRLDDGFGELVIERLGDRAVVMTRYGLVMLDREGSPVGVDARESGAPILLSALAQDHAVTLQAPPEDAEQGTGVYPLTILSASSLKSLSRTGLTMGDAREPQTMAITDGRIYITCGAITAYVDAPIRK